MKKRYIVLAVILALALVVSVAYAQGITPTKIRQLVVDIDALVGRTLTVSGGAIVTAPTTQATGVPVLKANGLGASNILEAAIAGTPAWYISSTGAESTGHPEAFTNNVKVAIPTAQTTATPGLYLSSLGASQPLYVDANTTPIAALNKAGDLRIAGMLAGTSGANVTVTQGSTIACITTVCKITAAGAVGALMGAPSYDGQVVFLVNVGAQTITITETGNLHTAGNMALGTLDAAGLVSDGTGWYQFGISDN
jgi:hypothetical protein